MIYSPKILSILRRLYSAVEYHSVCPLVRIGSAQPLFRKRVCSPPPPGTKGGEAKLACRFGGGGGGPNPDGWRESLALCLLNENMHRRIFVIIAYHTTVHAGIVYRQVYPQKSLNVSTFTCSIYALSCFQMQWNLGFFQHGGSGTVFFKIRSHRLQGENSISKSKFVTTLRKKS